MKTLAIFVIIALILATTVTAGLQITGALSGFQPRPAGTSSIVDSTWKPQGQRAIIDPLFKSSTGRKAIIDPSFKPQSGQKAIIDPLFKSSTGRKAIIDPLFKPQSGQKVMTPKRTPVTERFHITGTLSGFQPRPAGTSNIIDPTWKPQGQRAIIDPSFKPQSGQKSIIDPLFKPQSGE